MRAIIIDDEQHCIDTLIQELININDNTVELIGAFTTVEDGIKAIQQLHPDLIFLDVEIHNKTGFDLIKQIPEINFDIIFTTAYDKYAVQAFKFSAVDYLLKPIDADELQTAIKKSKEKHSQKERSEKIDALLFNLKSIHTNSRKICVPVITGFVFLNVDDIIRCESSINYSTLFLKNKETILVAKTLKEFEEMLAEHNFFRVHNSHLINLNCIKSYNKGKGGSVELEDGYHIEVSTRRKDDFLKRIHNL